MQLIAKVTVTIVCCSKNGYVELEVILKLAETFI